MMALALWIVFVIAKAAALMALPGPLSWQWLLAAWWQDSLIALCLVVIERLFSRPRFTLVVYWVLVLYAAANIPVMRALGTPFTGPMFRAAGAALSDSIFYYITPGNAAWVTVTLIVACVAVRLTKRIHEWAAAALLVLLAVGGRWFSLRLDTGGYDRNVVAALITSGLPHIEANQASADWRERHPLSDAGDLTRLRAAAAGRNVILVSLESTAAQYLGLYGASPDPMPRLSNMAQQAVLFSNAYAVYPESIKGLYSVLCSQYPAFDQPIEVYARVPCAALPETLQGLGYRTALFHSGRFDYLGMQNVIRNRGFRTLADAGHIGGNHNSSFGVDEHSTVQAMLRWIDSIGNGQRFFLTYLPIAGHHPYESPEGGPFPEPDEFGRYRNALADADRAVGVLTDAITARGLQNKTLWIIFGDHGEAFGQHAGNFGHTFHLYEENIRVPLAIIAPGLIERPLTADRVVSLVDITPTVLDLLGVAPPPDYQGGSALTGEHRMALFFTDYSLGLVGLRSGPHKLIHDLSSGRSKLFDLSRDPAERFDISRLHPQEVSRYAQHLRAWGSAQKYRVEAFSRSSLD